MSQPDTEAAREEVIIRERRKGREKQATTAFFAIPDSKIRSIFPRADANYDILFDNDQWRLARAKVEAGETDLPPLDVRDARRPLSASRPE